MTTPVTSPNGRLKVPQVAEVLGVKPNRVRQLVAEARLPAVKDPHTGEWTFGRRDVEAFAALDRRPGHPRSRSFDPFEPYVRQRLRRNPRVPATRLWDSCVERGYDRSYATFRTELNRRGLRQPQEGPT